MKRDLLKIFEALSDDTRLRMLHILMGQESCVLEVVKAMRISQTRASRNLGILQDAGLLKSRRVGPEVFYSVDTRNIRKYPGLDEMVKQAFSIHLLDLLDRERLKRPIPRNIDK